MKALSTVLALTSASYAFAQTIASLGLGSLPSNVPSCAVRPKTGIFANGRYRVQPYFCLLQAHVPMVLQIQHVCASRLLSWTPPHLVSRRTAVALPNKNPPTPLHNKYVHRPVFQSLRSLNWHPKQRPLPA